VIASSTSCALMLKREAREILGVEDPALVDVSQRTYDIFEYLRDLHEQGRLKTDFVRWSSPSPITHPASSRIN